MTAKKFELKLETKAKHDKTVRLTPAPGQRGLPTLLITPPINEDYWIARVVVSKKNAIVAFPKFSTFGIGFQHEVGWNANLPFTSRAGEIYEHIKHNSGGRVDRELCIKAIEMLQEHCQALMDVRSISIDGAKGMVVFELQKGKADVQTPRENVVYMN